MLHFDLETTNLDKGWAGNKENRVLLVSWAEDDGPRRHWYGDNWLEAVEFWQALDRHRALCAFNSKFEQQWIARAVGIDKMQSWLWHDPMLAQRVLDGNLQKKYSLDAIAKRYALASKDPLIDSMMKAGVCPSQMPAHRLIARCRRDVDVTRSLMRAQKKLLTENGCYHLYAVRCQFQAILAEMELTGAYLDKVRVTQTYNDFCLRRAELKHSLDGMTGGINLRSSNQVAEFLYDKLGFPERRNAKGKPVRNKPNKRWPDGAPLTDQGTLAWLETQATTEEQSAFIRRRREYGKANAAITKNLEFFLGTVLEKDCWFSAQFNMTVAATHRLTSSGRRTQFEAFKTPKAIQLQNSPREFKGLYCAPDGYQVAEVDHAQLEFRVAAFAGQDQQAMSDILNPDFDAHCTSASVMNQFNYTKLLQGYRAGDKKCAKMRQDAKPDTFKPLYGGTKGTPEQERWYQEFQRRYSGVYSAQEGWVAEVAATGKLELPWGMTFYWPNCRVDRRGVLIDSATGRPIGPRIFNYPVQELATAEITPIAIIGLHKWCREHALDVKFAITVHDSVVCYVKDDEHTINKFVEGAKYAFTTYVYDYLATNYGIDLNVPLGCEIKIGHHWGEGATYKHDDALNWRTA